MEQNSAGQRNAMDVNSRADSPLSGIWNGVMDKELEQILKHDAELDAELFKILNGSGFHQIPKNNIVAFYLGVLKTVQTMKVAQSSLCNVVRAGIFSVIRSKQLFQEMGYDSFEKCCLEEFGVNKSQAHDLANTYELFGLPFLKSLTALGFTFYDFRTMKMLPPEIRTEFVKEGKLEVDGQIYEIKNGNKKELITVITELVAERDKRKKAEKTLKEKDELLKSRKIQYENEIYRLKQKAGESNPEFLTACEGVVLALHQIDNWGELNESDFRLYARTVGAAWRKHDIEMRNRVDEFEEELGREIDYGPPPTVKSIMKKQGDLND